MAAPSADQAARQRTFPARFEILPETAAFVEAFCAAHDIAHHDALRVVLVVEELVTNAISHGHGGGCDAPITIGLTSNARGIALHYEDTAPAFDPMSALDQSRSPLDAPLETRPEGQLGMRLIGQIASRARYAYTDGRNCLWLFIERQDR